MKTQLLCFLLALSLSSVLSRHHRRHGQKKNGKKEDEKPAAGGIDKKDPTENIYWGSCLLALLDAHQTDNFDMCECVYTMGKGKDGKKCKQFIGKEIQMGEVKEQQEGILKVEVHKLEGLKCVPSCLQQPLFSGNRVLEEVNREFGLNTEDERRRRRFRKLHKRHI